VALAAFAAVRRAAALCCCAPDVQQSTNFSYPPGQQQQTRRTLQQTANGKDRRTDIRTTHRFVDPASPTVRAVPTN